MLKALLPVAGSIVLEWQVKWQQTVPRCTYFLWLVAVINT